MTYNVFGGTLSLTQSIITSLGTCLVHRHHEYCCYGLVTENVVTVYFC